MLFVHLAGAMPSDIRSCVIHLTAGNGYNAAFNRYCGYFIYDYLDNRFIVNCMIISVSTENDNDDNKYNEDVDDNDDDDDDDLFVIQNVF